MTFTRLMRANLARNRIRTALTGLAILLATMLVSILLTMPAGLDAFINSMASDTRISVHHKAGVVYPMPLSFTRKVRQVKGVAAAVSSTWFGGAFEEQGRVTFPSFAVEPEHIGAVFPDYAIPAEQLADFQRYRDGAIVGRQTMLRYGWKVGDRVTLDSTVWAVQLDLRIVGEIPNERSPLVWLNREYVDQAIKAQGREGFPIVSVIWVRVEDPAQVNAIMATIDDLSRNTEAETACETEKSFFSNFLGSLQGLVRIIILVTALVSLCILFIASNTASMGVRERAPEIAVLKAIGFSRTLIFFVLVAETVALAVTAGAGGVGMAYGLTRLLRAYAGYNPQLGPLGSFLVTPGVMLQGLVIAFLIGVLAGFAPALGAARRPVVQTLREVF